MTCKNNKIAGEKFAEISPILDDGPPIAMLETRNLSSHWSQ